MRNNNSNTSVLLRLKKEEKEYLCSLAKTNGKTIEQYIKDILSIAAEKDYKKTEVFSIVKDCLIKIRDKIGGNFKRGIIYGSYARGDFRNDSDVDLLVLLENTSAETESDIISIICDFNTDYNIYISPVVLDEITFNGMDYGVYRNIKKEGVLVYGE